MLRRVVTFLFLGTVYKLFYLHTYILTYLLTQVYVCVQTRYSISLNYINLVFSFVAGRRPYSEFSIFLLCILSTDTKDEMSPLMICDCRQKLASPTANS